MGLEPRYARHRVVFCTVFHKQKTYRAMKINVINTDKVLQVELKAESDDDREEIRKFITNQAMTGGHLSFPREDVVNSVKIKLVGD